MRKETLFLLGLIQYYMPALLDLSEASLSQNLNDIGLGTGICLACLKPHMHQ